MIGASALMSRAVPSPCGPGDGDVWGVVAVITCWSAKGGSGTSVVAAALAVLLARRPQGALLVDLCGDQPALLGCREPQGHGVRDWLVSATDTPPDALGRLEMDVVTGLRLLPTGSGGDVGARHPTETSAQQAQALAGVLGRDLRGVVVDAGCVLGGPSPGAEAAVTAGASSLLVVRPCYLALRRALATGLRPTGVVVVSEPWRALAVGDVAEVLGAPVVAEVAVDPAVGRAVDAGVLAQRLPRGLHRALANVV